MDMKNGPGGGPADAWIEALVRALVSGTAASVLSTIALVARGKAELNDPIAPLNGPSQWVFGKHAAYQRGFRFPHTVVGYLIHHAMSVLWATLFERWGRRTPVPGRMAMALIPAAVTSAAACAVDYRLTPERLTPGFEKRLSRRSLAFVYVAFAIGLAAGASLRSR